jgi:hypothetical protein
MAGVTLFITIRKISKWATKKSEFFKTTNSRENFMDWTLY